MGEAAPQPPGTEATGGAENANNVKMSSAWHHAALGAAVGGGLGAAGSLIQGGKVPELQAKLQQAEMAARDGSYGSAARLAALKANLATAQLAQQHPGMAALSSAVPGAIAGGIFGPTLVAKAKRAKSNITDALR